MERVRVATTLATLGLLASSATAQVSFFLSPGTDPSGDLNWQAAVGSASIAEEDFENGCPLPLLDFGGVEALVELVDAAGVADPMAPIKFNSGAFMFPGVVFNQTVLNNDGFSVQDAHPRIRFTFSRPVSGFGAWVFDDEDPANFQFVMRVTLVDGQVVTSDPLDTGVPGFTVDGFLGAVALGGIVSVTVEQQQVGGAIAADAHFELDHLQTASHGLVGTSYCAPAQNSTGVPGRISASGSVLVSDQLITLTANELPANQFGYFLAGQTQGMFMPPTSQGIICLQGNIGRYQGDIIQGPVGSLQIDLTSIPVNPPQAVLTGDTWNFQCWYRDNNPGPTSNFTDAVSITFQ